MSELQKIAARATITVYNKSKDHKEAVRVFNKLPETRKKRRKALLGTHLDPRIKAKISKTRIERGVASGEKNPMFGKTHSSETREKLRRSNEKQFSDPKAREHHRKMRLKQIIPYVSSSEITLKEALNQTGFFPIPQYPLEITQIDLAFPTEKIAIYVDGCYWHCCPIHYPRINPKGNQDSYVNEHLRRRDWKVLRFWEHEIKNNIERVIGQIKEEVVGSVGGTYSSPSYK